MPMPKSEELFGRVVVARVKDEVFAVQAGICYSSFIRTSVVQELGLSFLSRDASIVIGVGTK